MLAECKKLEKQMHLLKLKLNEFPPGKLICSRNGGQYKWYHRNGKNKTYIPKKNRHFAEQLAAKTYLAILYDDLDHERRAIASYFRHHSSRPWKSDQINEHPEYRKLLASHFTPLSQELTEWMNSPYEQNKKYPEQLIHETGSGHFVRSKSEALIVMGLDMYKIPFRYENAIQLGEITIYPDFTIRHPETGAIYYWENFGIMDDSSYSRKAMSKLQLYIDYGIIPSHKLIITFESKENPLTTAMGISSNRRKIVNFIT